MSEDTVEVATSIPEIPVDEDPPPDGDNTEAEDKTP